MKIFLKFFFGLAAVASLNASAQVAIPVKTFLLTNSTTFTVAGAGTNIASAGTTIINSQPFPIYRGRGFALHTSTVAANPGTSNNVYTFQTTTPISNAGILTTNWSTAGT